MSSPSLTVRRQQAQWAARHMKIDAAGYAYALEQNLIAPLSEATRAEFENGDGSEPGLWAKFGFSLCQEFAVRLNAGVAKPRWLHAEQLLKHVLGLATTTKPWTLVYLWYEIPGPASAEHATEIEEFSRMVSADSIVFRAITYQSLFQSLQLECGGAHGAYLKYLGERYFSASN